MDKSQTSVNLEGPLGDFAEQQVASGRFGSVVEVVHAGLRLLEDEDSKLQALRAALIEGEESGPAVDFDFDEFLAERRASFAKQ